MSTRLGVALILAASAWGQVYPFEPRPDAISPHQQEMQAEAFASNLFDTNGSSAEVPKAEDSAFSATMNQAIYGNPRGIQPDPLPSRAGTVSVDQLRHRVSRKGAKLLDRAHRFAAGGLHEKAIAEYKRAMDEPSAAPYAHSLLGAEYLRLHDLPDAIAELQQAAEALPHCPENLSNLGLAFLLVGDLDRGEQEARLALSLDGGNPKTHKVLAQILEARKTPAAGRR